MTCKDCYHEPVCTIVHDSITQKGIYRKETCQFFKDKSRIAEVVRCEDCLSWKECGIDPITNYHFGYCRHYQWQDKDDSRETNGQDFCSYGERRSDAE